MTKRLLKPGNLLAFLFSLIVASNCHAGSIQLTPVRINLSNAAKVAVLTVHNTGTEESVMQVSLNKWTHPEGKDIYLSSDELVITPVTFRLPAGAQQIVRIGLRDDTAANSEASYRLLVEEVPEPITTATAGTGARLIVRHDLPVFVAPVAVANAALDMTVVCEPAGAQLRLTNMGNVHAQLRHVVLSESADSKELGRMEAFDYLLPEANKSWELAQVMPGYTGKSIVVTALTDQGSFTADVDNTCI